LWKVKRGPAVLFENVKGSSIPLVGNVLNTRRKMALAMGIEESEVFDNVVRAVENPIKPVPVEDAPCQEVVVTEGVDLMALLPIPRIHEKDGGPYLSAAVFITKDPDTGIGNVSLNRLHILGPDKMATNMSPTNTYENMRRCWERGEPLECAAVIGSHPAVLVASNMLVPFGFDELEIAGGLFGKPLEVVRGKTVDLKVPAATEVVIEGEIRPNDLDEEGPFGEFAGLYAARKQNPVIRVRAVTFRSNPLLQTINGSDHPEHLIIGGIAREATLFQGVRDNVSSVKRVFMGEGGSCRLSAVIAMNPRTEGEAKRAILAAFANQVLLKYVVAVDEDVDLEDPLAVERAIATRVRAERDILILPGIQSSPVVPLSENFTVSKLGIDATRPLDKPAELFEPAGVPEEVMRRVKEDWASYLPDGVLTV
jgi:2,5-furandicarboxylate decarboxylase 1